MILHCPSCSARYEVPAEAAASPAVTFRCTNCGTMFGPAEGLSMPASRSQSVSRSTEVGLPPPRGLRQVSGAEASVQQPEAVGSRALPPSNLPPSYGEAPGQSHGLPGANVPDGGALPSGFRDGVLESQAPVAVAGTETVPKRLDSLPDSGGVRFDSQSAKTVPTPSLDIALPAPGVPVKPIDAEAFFDDKSEAASSVGAGGVERSQRGLRGGVQRGKPQAAELPHNPVVSGFGVPAREAVGVAPDGGGASPAPQGTQSFIAPPVVPSRVVGGASNPIDVHPAPDPGDVWVPTENERQGVESAVGTPTADSGLWSAGESKVIALPDVPIATSCDSSELDAVPRRDRLPQGLPPAMSTTDGIRRISRPGPQSSSAMAVPGLGSVSVTGASAPVVRRYSSTGAPPQSEAGSTVFRLSDLDGETGMDLDPGLSATFHAVDVDFERERVTQTIDPLVEFHDVFQDIRRAEKGDDRSATERYFDTGLFSGVEEQTPESEEKARLEREAREARMREGRLDLKGGTGGLAHQIEREVSPTDVSHDAADDLLAAALAEAGLREPSTDVETVKEEAARAAVVDLNVAGEPVGSPTFPNAARYLTVLLVCICSTIGLLMFVASKNNGFLDFTEFDQMLGVAFKGETYEPRYQPVLQIVQSAEGWVAEDLEQIPATDGNGLAVGDLIGGQYEAGHGAVFTLVDGTVTNTTGHGYRAVEVEVTLRTESGEVAGVRIVPAGVRIEQPLFEEILEPERLTGEYDRLRGLLAEVELEPTRVTTFSAAFLLGDDVRVSELMPTARVLGAERERDSCWSTVVFSTPDAAEASPRDE